MKDYVESLIEEQINRALTLKTMIHYPLAFNELTALADRCTSILDGQVQTLRELQGIVRLRTEDDLRDVFREVRISTQEILLVEYFGIHALYLQTPEIGFLNRLIHRIHGELRVPLPAPAVCCTGTQHYFTDPFTNVIFVPLGEAAFLLHMPDLYHELGHYVLNNVGSDLRLEPLDRSYEQAMREVTEHYRKLLKTKRREGGPDEIRMAIERIHAQWKTWLREFFCDLFALYTAGPTYAWSHLHLTAKQSEDIHRLSIFFAQEHPSDEARMRMLLAGLGNLGFTSEASEIARRWKEMVDAGPWVTPPANYQYAYPDELLLTISKGMLEGLSQSRISVFLNDGTADGEVRLVLNEAWKVFWNRQPDEFRAWEQKQLESLRKKLA